VPVALKAAAGTPEEAIGAAAAPGIGNSISHAGMEAAGKAQSAHGSMSAADSSGAKGADAAAARQHQDSATARSRPDKQKHQKAPASQSAQNSREATPELKLDQLEVHTDQVKWQPHKEHFEPCSLTMSVMLAWTLKAFTQGHACGAGWQVVSKWHSCACIQGGEGRQQSSGC
jgi:hypothetical protein